jgi:hypothetical protein
VEYYYRKHFDGVIDSRFSHGERGKYVQDSEIYLNMSRARRRLHKGKANHVLRFLRDSI